MQSLINHITKVFTIQSAEEITKSDTGDHPYDAITVRVTGDVGLILVNGDNIVVNCIAGEIYHYKIITLKTTGTAATGLVGLNKRT